MSALVYLSPLPWASFAQRPQHFVRWCHAAGAASSVLWLDPYPTRLPQLADLRRLRRAGEPAQPVPDWLQVLPVPALPVEPLPLVRALHDVLWRPLLRQVTAWAGARPCDIVVAKPSRLALAILRAARFRRRVYDAMDDFPAFHRGLSARAMAHAERALLREVDELWVSSTGLARKFAEYRPRPPLRLVRNACDPATLPGMQECLRSREPDLVGYVGTIAGWFDWPLLLGLARSAPALRFRLIGPLLQPPPEPLPPNVELRPPCAHDEAMREMARFSVGLIPFRRTPLTHAVDPVKYYEYRGCGIPVLSTAFGEMAQHAEGDGGVFLLEPGGDPARTLQRALGHRDTQAAIGDFRSTHAWGSRFAGTVGAASAAAGIH